MAVQNLSNDTTLSYLFKQVEAKIKNAITAFSQKVVLQSSLPLALNKGGTGQTAVSSTTTVSQIATAATNATISSASYAQWGKIAMVQIAITRSINTGTNTDVTVATLVSGKRPATTASATIRYSGSVNFAYINTAGGIIINTATSIPPNTTLYIDATYILA